MHLRNKKMIYKVCGAALALMLSAGIGIPAMAESATGTDHTDMTASEVGDATQEFITLVSSLSDENAGEVTKIRDRADDLRDRYEALDSEEQETLAESRESFENAYISLNVYLNAVKDPENADTAAEDAGSDEDMENSFRYINGEPVTDALDTVEEETQEAEQAEKEDAVGEEQAGAEGTASKQYGNGISVPESADVAIVRTEQGTEMIPAAEAETLSKSDSSQVSFGVDVSHHNGNIDWAAAKADGVKFAIIRCGQGSSARGKVNDRKWEQNIAGCEKQDIPWGVYLYSKALSADEAEAEAEHTLDLLEGHEPDLPVFFDIEDSTLSGLDKQERTGIALAYMKKIEKAGYQTGIYSSMSWFQKYFQDIVSDYPDYYIWTARWPKNATESIRRDTENKVGRLDLWQFSDDGEVDGISGSIDTDYWYGTIGYSVEQSDSGNWYYMKNHRQDYTYSGIAESDDLGSVYVEKGKVDLSKNGVLKCGGIRYNFKNGVVQKKETVAYGEGSWWYIGSDGRTNTAYNGLASNHNGTWYIKNGKVDFSKTGVLKCGDGWYNFKNGKVQKKETVAHTGNEWWYIGKNGKADFSYNGVATNGNGTWYIKNGRVDFSKTGVLECGKNWYRFKNGKVQKYVTVAENKNGWWYIDKNGKVDFSYNGVATNGNGTWYIKNGKVDFSKTGVLKCGKNWYHFKNGKVQKYVTVAENKNGWWYIDKNGKVDFSYTGFASNRNGTWYVEKGKVTFRYNGTVRGRKIVKSKVVK